MMRAARGTLTSVGSRTGRRIVTPDYKKLYFTLFRASEEAVRLLQEAQARAEEEYLCASAPPLRLPPPDSAEAGPDGPEPGGPPG